MFYGKLNDDIVKALKGYNVDTLPKSMLLIGETGCGKHSISKEISNELGLRYMEITENLSEDELYAYSVSGIPSLYIIDLDKLTLQKENAILKFIEEPPDISNTVLLSSDVNSVIQTIVNRCICYEFKSYSQDELAFICKKDISDLYGIAHTPGQYLKWMDEDLHKVFDLCEKILTKTKAATVPNILTVADKIKFDDKDMSKEKIDFLLFLNILTSKSAELYLDKHIEFSVYKETEAYIKNTKIKNINQQMLLINYLLRLKVL